MKYIDSNKLIAEIERMREINRKAFESEHIESGVFHGRAQAINHLFEFIDSLRQEQPEVELGMEIDNWLDAEPHTVRDTAIHFYELGLNARK